MFLACAAALPVVLLAALQFAWPWLLDVLDEPLAAAVGVDRLELVASRPGLDRLTIERLAVEAGRLELVAEQGVLRYRLREMITGGLRSAVFETVRLSVLPPVESEEVSDFGGLPDLAGLFAALPADGVSVRELDVRVPALGFRAAGSLSADPHRFELELTGRAPAEAQDFLLRVGGTPDGAVEARLAEPGSGEAPVLDVRSRVVGTRRELSGTAALSGLPWQIAAHVAGLSAGELAAAGSFTALLPWPLPSDWFGQLDASARLQGRWRPPGEAPALEAAAAEWRLRGGVLTGALDGTLVHSGVSLPARIELDSVQRRQASLTGRGTLRIAEAIAVPFSVLHRLDAGAGTLAAEVAHRIDAPLAESLLRPWERRYDLTGGRIEAELALRWPADRAALAGRVRLRLSGVDGFYGDYRLSGLQGLVELTSGDDGGWSMPPGRLHADLVDLGVALRDVETTLAWSGEQVNVDALSLQLLGGRARAEPFVYRFDGGASEFVVELASVDLAQVLALTGDQVSGNGVLDGRLPVRIEHGAASVAGGQIRAVAPGGVIRVAPALTVGTGQPGVDFALRALEDFRYQRLTADADYSADGDLTLAVRLEGRNPQVEAGRPIHYNLTVTQNVPTLLRALRLQEQVTRRIEREARD